MTGKFSKIFSKIKQKEIDSKIKKAHHPILPDMHRDLPSPHYIYT
jgi:hypothetical protein